MEKIEEKYECAECGRTGDIEEVVFCGGCEDFYCYNIEDGCSWINKEGEDLYICEACHPRDCEAGFIVDSVKKRILLESPGKFIQLGQDINKAVGILKKSGYISKYRLDREEKRIVKYGKDCGIYLLFDVNGKVISIGMWTGKHRTDKDLSFYDTKDDMVEIYGDGFTVEDLRGYLKSYHYPEHNLKFVLTRVGAKREVVTEITLC